HFQSAYSSSASVFLARRMGIRWFLNVHGGGSYSVVTHQASGTPIGSQVIGGGSLGFRAGMHTLVGSSERSSSDPFGFAVGTISTASGAWSWHHPGSRWGLSVSGGQQQTRNTGFVSLSGWQASGGVNTSLNANASMSLQYVYIDSMGAYLGTVNHLTAHSIRVSMGWAPQNVNR